MPGATDLPIEGKTVKALASVLAKRSHDLFQAGTSNHAQENLVAMESQVTRVSVKVRDEYAHVSEGPYGQGMHASHAALPSTTSAMTGLAGTALTAGTPSSEAEAARRAREALTRSRAVVERHDGTKQQYVASIAVAKRLASRWPRPKWHPPWRLYRTIAGHLGPVRSIAFDTGNQWFATGSGDRTIKVWDTASGQLKLTLTGHIEQVTGLAVSAQHPYMFSCGLDKKVMCWDLEQNKTIRHYHGHLSGVMAIKVHPVLPLLMTAGRDSTCRLWDMRSRVQVHCMSGHQGAVASILALATDPQCITGSHDSTVRLWDIRMGKSIHILTHHKKSVRALAMNPSEFAFISGSPDNIKKFKLPDGEFCHNFIQRQETIINAMGVNDDGVVASGGDNGTLWCWDWKSGNCFQQGQTIAQPGSLESENGIYALSFDMSGSRLVTCEADKTVKMWKPDDAATPETHPINFSPPKDIIRRY